MPFIRLPVICLLVAMLAPAQVPLSPEDAAKVNRAFAQGIGGDPLKCTATPIHPFLDFAFRFNAGYVASCPVKEFDGKESTLAAYLRITPAGAPPVVLAEVYTLPGIPPQLASHTEIKKLRASFETSGGFALGEGEFTIDLLLVDNRHRIYQKRWTARTRRTGHEQNVALSMPPHTVTALPAFSWDGQSPITRSPRPRLTILLDAAPINPYATKLRVWDRSFLLGSLSTLLRETPAESVRLIAFNLDQQNVLFRADPFDAAAFQKLSQTLEHLELSTISYKMLRKEGWSELLARLVNSEVTAANPSDIVIFLGPTARYTDKVPPTMVMPRKADIPQFFYLEYFPIWRMGREFPDAIHHATDAYKGTVLKIHSPADFAEAMRKVNQRMQLSHLSSPPPNDTAILKTNP